MSEDHQGSDVTPQAIIASVTYDDRPRKQAGARYFASQICDGIVCYQNSASSAQERTGIARRLAQDTESLLTLQHKDGTIDSGNLRTPPDTGFVMEALGAALTGLRNSFGADLPDEFLARAVEHIDMFMVRAAQALVTGGIHTPNHRWVVCAALAYAYHLYGTERCLQRINEWLSEGIDIDADGQYSERSPGIYAGVSSRGLFVTGVLLNRTELFDPIRRNLDTTLLLVQPDGRIETAASRRQDQYDTNASWFGYHYLYRYFAIHDQNRTYAAAARALEEKSARDDHAPLRHYASINFAFPSLQQPLPESTPADLPMKFSRHLSGSGLVRSRSGANTLTVFGGHDRWTDGLVTPEVSGRSANPTVLTFCAGAASIRWLRIIPSFFTIGYLRPKLESVTQGTSLLISRREVGYFQPLPPDKRRSDGQYELSTGDGRFWSATSLTEREVTNLQELRVQTTVSEQAEGCEVVLGAEASTDVTIGIELAADPESDLYSTTNSAGESELTITRGASQITVSFASESATTWQPHEREYGDANRMRRLAEQAVHAENPLALRFFAFTAPGSARLKIHGTTKGESSWIS